MAYGINIFDSTGDVIFTGNEPVIIPKGKFVATKASDGTYAFDDGVAGQVAVKIPVGESVSGYSRYNTQNSLEYIRLAPATDVSTGNYGLATYNANGQTTLTDSYTPVDFVGGIKITTTDRYEEHVLSNIPEDAYIHFDFRYHTIWWNAGLNAPIFMFMYVERTSPTTLKIANDITGPGEAGPHTEMTGVVYHTVNNCVIAFKEA